MSPRIRRNVGLSAYAIFALVVFFVLLRASGTPTPGSGGYRVVVVLPDATNLSARADVRVGGVKVGQVDAVRQTGGNAIAKLRLDDDAAQIYTNAHVRLRYKSPLNEGYVDLFPGGGAGARVIPDNGELPLSRADETVQVDQVLSTLDARTRRRLQQMLDGTSTALQGHGGDLNDLLGAASQLLGRGDRALSILADQRQQTARLIDYVGQVTAALGARQTALRILARRARTTAEAVDARNAEFRQMFRQLPPTLEQVRSTTSDLAAFSATATPVVSNLRVALNALAPTIRQLRPAVASTREALHALSAFTPRAKVLLRRLAPFATAAAALMPPVDGFLRQLNPLTQYLSSQRNNLAAFFSLQAAATEATDSTGHLQKLSFLFNREALKGLSPQSDNAIKALEDAGVLTQISGKVRFNPYPADGSIAKPAPFAGTYPRLEAQPPVLKGSP